MASLFKLRITRYVDESGKRARKDAAGAKRIQQKSKKWYGEYKDVDGVTRRTPLSTDKAAAQAMLNDIVRNVERRIAGLFDPFDEHQKRPLLDHLDDYNRYLRAKGDSDQHVSQSVGRIRKLVAGCGFKMLPDIDASKIAIWLADQRTTRKRFSAQTSNFYLDAFKYFCTWLVTHERHPRNPVTSLKRLNVDTDRRHHRRALVDEEFLRLIEAAESGPVVEGIAGQDRAMLYVLATWTGYRRRELASLRLRSVELDAGTPSIRLEAAYSKRRRQDTIPLHSYVVDRLKTWLNGRPDNSDDSLLFKLKTPKGHFRKTAKMMQRDLKSARLRWIEEADSETERTERKESDFLQYLDENGLFADFHANRHTFISNLGRAGVPLAMAQKLARHSDPRLTSNRYTHLEMDDKAAAISTLPTPVKKSNNGVKDRCSAGGPESLVAGMVAGAPAVSCHESSPTGITASPGASDPPKQKPLPEQGLDTECHELTVIVEVHPEGLEPPTLGSEDRCSIQLSYGCVS